MKDIEIIKEDRTLFGFWVYLMTDLLIFAALFAAYVVLHKNNFGGPTTKEIFDLPFALAETIILLTSSFTCGIGLLFARQGDKNKTIAAFAITFALGISFISMEISEFSHLFIEGNGFQRSAFLSSFFTLVGTHGLHVTCGLIWMILLMLQVTKHGIGVMTTRKLTCLSLFWHFLDIVWIFVFTVVYLMGAV